MHAIKFSKPVGVFDGKRRGSENPEQCPAKQLMDLLSTSIRSGPGAKQTGALFFSFCCLRLILTYARLYVVED